MNRNKLIMILFFGAHVLLMHSVRSQTARTSTTTTEERTTTQRAATTETGSGTVTTTYEPGKIIVVGSESGNDTFGFVLDKTVRYVNKAGRGIDEHLIKRGTRIDVYYDGTGETRVVNHVVVDQD